MDEHLDQHVKASKPIPRFLLLTFEAYLPHVLGVTQPEHKEQVRMAARRLNAFVQTIPTSEPNVRSKIISLLTISFLHGWLMHFRAPWSQSATQRTTYVERLFHSDDLLEEAILKAGSYLPLAEKTSIRDIARALRELMGLTFYSNPDTDKLTGFDPVWTRREHWRSRPDVDFSKIPGPSPSEIDIEAAARVHFRGHPYDTQKLFHCDGRPKVAVIGSGAGGAVVAARLAQTGKFDVAVFEAGPSLKPPEYPIDTLVGMSQLFEDGILTTSDDLDIHLMRGRVVGGSTVVTSGLTVRLRPRTFDAFTNGLHAETYMGIERATLEAAFDTVQARLSMGTISPELFTDISGLLKKGAAVVNEVSWRFDKDLARNNVMMERGQHGPRPGQMGDYCLGCGMCNYGCHYGHKLSMDLTYLPDAEAAGAQVHPNLPVEHIVGETDGEKMRAVALKLGRGIDTLIAVDHVVVAAGAVGSPALLLRTAEEDGRWNTLSPFKRDQVGTGIGFNYGSGVMSRFENDFNRPGHMGFQIRFVATKSPDEAFTIHLEDGNTHRARFVLENAHLPPGLLSNLVPGVGESHRHWMANYRNLAMTATTIGSPQTGRVYSSKRVRYKLNDDEMELNQRALASVVRLYLAAGAAEVGLAGVRQNLTGDPKRLGEGTRFTAERHGHLKEAQLFELVRQTVQSPEHLMLSSGHPQGGLRMNANPELGAVGSDFRLNGSTNVFVADASLLPSTIVINPLWTVAALGEVAGISIADTLGRNS